MSFHRLGSGSGGGNNPNNNNNNMSSSNYNNNNGGGGGALGNTNNNPRKFTIKPFRSYTQMDANSARLTFESLASAMDEIHNRNASTLSFEELYRNAYNLVLHKHGNLLYEGVSDRLGLHLRRSGRDLVRLGRASAGGMMTTTTAAAAAGGGGPSIAAAAKAAGGGKGGSYGGCGSGIVVIGADTSSQYRLLEDMARVWVEHRITMVMVRDIFMYMDRTYVPQHRRRPVYDLGLWLFRRVVWERDIEDYDDDDDDDGGGGGGGHGPSGDDDERRRDSSGKKSSSSSTNVGPAVLLGSVASSLLLRAIHQDRLDRLVDAPQRMTLLRDLIQMLLELGQDQSSSYSTGSGGGRTGGGGGAVGGNPPSLSRDDVPVYERDFEEAFLGESQDFYRTESASRLSRAEATGAGGAMAVVAREVSNDVDDDDGKPAARYSAMEYVRRARVRLEEEKNRAALLDLPSQTRMALLRIVETELIEKHARTLVEMEGSGFACILKVVAGSPSVGSVAAASADARTISMGGGGGGATGSSYAMGGGLGDIPGVVIDTARIADLSAMYDLFGRVPSSVNHLRDALSERIKLDGRALVRDQETGVSPPAAFVKGVLDMRERFHAVVTIAMRGEKRAQKRMSEAFEDFLNADARAANCLAVYVDELLRVGLRGADERTVARELDRVIIIFRYLADKDVFEAYYKNHLAKRLLGTKSGSEEAERAMVSLLKAECGYQFTSKLEGMFNDMRISKETLEKYRTHKKGLVNVSPDVRDAENGGKAVDVEVSVLANSHWPSQNVQPCILPTAIGAAMDRFKNYYLTTYTGRKLSWQTSTGTAEIRLNLPPAKGSTKPRRHDLTVTTYQMCILVLFNVRDTLTLKQIRDDTQIPEDELRRHLVSLCTPKHRILRKGSKGKGISGDDDTFTYNSEFTSKMTRVKIPLVSMRDAAPGSAIGGGTAEGFAGAGGGAGGSDVGPSSSNRPGGLVDRSFSVPVAVEEDRRHLLEAAIVRIMKARKSLSHNDLVAEVTRQLSGRFVPSPQFVKKRVESLIEREYLERDEHDRRIYRYMA
jgi:cullin 3